MNVSIDIDKSQIIEALARTTGYLGTKAIEADKDTYDRISLNEGDTKIVERFFKECRDRLCLALRHHLESETVAGQLYKIVLKLSPAFDRAMEATLQSGILNYFIQSMAAKWLAITDKAQAAEYANAAMETLEYIVRKIYCKQKPKRPTF